MDPSGPMEAPAPVPDTQVSRQWKVTVGVTREDCKALLMLLGLYIIQGIPMGLRAAIPLVIHDSVSYSQMAYLSFTGLPFCLKLLWAPVVDSLHYNSLGKRKSWILPVQVFSGALLLYGGIDRRIDRWVGHHGEPVNVLVLTIYFTVLYMLMATQDIVVDGWALSLLRPEMRIHASTCNTAGQALGVNIAFMGFTMLNSRNMCVRLYRLWLWWLHLIGIERPPLSDEDALTLKPFASLSDFTWFFGIVTIICTVLIYFKDEVEEQPVLVDLPRITELGISERYNIRSASKVVCSSYKLILEILKLKPTRLLCLLLLTYGFFYCAENPAELMILEKGISKDVFAAVSPLMIPLEIVGPIFITTIMHKSSTIDILYKGMCVRLFAMVLYIGVVIMTGIYYSEESHDALAKTSFYTFFILVSLFRRLCCLIVTVSYIALFARVSDPSIGGTYMTLLNTLMNIGELLPRMIGLWLIDMLGHPNRSGIDGLYLEVFLCTIAGVVLLPKYRKILIQMDSFETNEWYVNKFALE